jgi:hypothetical protein
VQTPFADRITLNGTENQVFHHQTDDDHPNVSGPNVAAAAAPMRFKCSFMAVPLKCLSCRRHGNEIGCPPIVDTLIH